MSKTKLPVMAFQSKKSQRLSFYYRPIDGHAPNINKGIRVSVLGAQVGYPSTLTMDTNILIDQLVQRLRALVDLRH